MIPFWRLTPFYWQLPFYWRLEISSVFLPRVIMCLIAGRSRVNVKATKRKRKKVVTIKRTGTRILVGFIWKRLVRPFATARVPGPTSIEKWSQDISCLPTNLWQQKLPEPVIIWCETMWTIMRILFFQSPNKKRLRQITRTGAGHRTMRTDWQCCRNHPFFIFIGGL